MPTETPKKERRKRRNYELEIRALRAYVYVKIEVLQSLEQATSSLNQVRIDELQAIAERIRE